MSGKPKHGLSRTSEYYSYYAAKDRCDNPRHRNFHQYGGRGIKFLFQSIEELLEDIGPRPGRMELDRINNDGHYEKGNVRWTSRSQQNSNRRTPRRKHQSGSIWLRGANWFVRYYGPDKK